MRRSMFFSAFGALSAAFVVLGAREASAVPMLIDYVQRQPSTPGVAEAGHFNITGVARAGSFFGSGATLTSLNASAISSGTLADARLSANVAQLNKNNQFSASQTFQSHLNLVAQNGGIAFPTPSLNSTTPMITMFGTGNSSYERTVLGVSSADTTHGLRYYGYSNTFLFRGMLGVFGVDLDGFVWSGSYGNPGNAVFYGSGQSGVTSAGRFNSNGSTYALTATGNVKFEANSAILGNLGVGIENPTVDIGIDDANTGFNGSAGALDAVVDGASVGYFRAGKLGIGRSPSFALDVQGDAHFRNSFGGSRIRIFTDSADVGNVWTTDPNSAAKAVMASRQTGGNYGAYVAACDGGGLPAAYLDCRASDYQGRVIADVKNFKAINPRDPATDIYYASLEGPEAAMYIRGKGRLVNGRAVVELPAHFTDLANAETLTIQLTPASFRSKGLGYEISPRGAITVGELGDGQGSYDFSWVVTAVRKGYEDYEVIRSWTEAPRPGLTEQEAWAIRMQRIAKARAMQP